MCTLTPRGKGVGVRDKRHIVGTVGLIRLVRWQDPDPVTQWSTLYRASPVLAPQGLRCLHKPLVTVSLLPFPPSEFSLPRTLQA